MNSYTVLQLYRLDRCSKRLLEEYKMNAPDIIKKIELSLIKEICDNLNITLKELA